MGRVARRKLAVEPLEGRVLLDATGVDLLPQEAAWEQVVVTFRDDVQNPQAAAESLVGPLSGRLGHVYKHAVKGFSAQLPTAALSGLAGNPLIEHIETDLVMRSFQQQLPTGIDRIDGELNPTGGTLGEGKSVDVDIAIIDSGIAAHPDLNIAGGRRFYTATTGPRWSRGVVEDDLFADDNGHGTHVAGIAAAKDDGEGVVGVAPGARLWGVKVLDQDGSGYMSDIIKGVDWVTENAATIEVANMSLGGVGTSVALHDAIKASVQAGVVYVVAAGNDWGDIHGADKTFGTSDDTIPAAYPEVATISAFADSDGQPGGLGPATSWGQYGEDDAWWGPSNFSNSDEPKNDAFLNANPVVSSGLGIDLTLPGADITSTWLDGGLRALSGTSMAAPHAAGLAALQIAAQGSSPQNAAEVYAVRQALIDAGQPWTADEGLRSPGPDKYQETLGWAGQTTVALAPTISIDSPASEAVVAGSVALAATAQAFGENVTVSHVGFEISDVSSGTVVDSGDVQTPDAEGLWTRTWETLDASGTPLFGDGAYRITAQATDTEGRTGISTVTVQLENVDDPPQVDFTSPADGTMVSGVVELKATASDDRQVKQVEFFAGEITLGVVDEPTSDGWGLAWDTNAPTWSDGTYTVRALVTDSGGQTSEASIAVTVNNSVSQIHAQLTGSASQINRNFWRAQATVVVEDSNGLPLAGASVTGRWVQEDLLVAGTTDSQGQLSFSSGNLRNGEEIDFLVVDIERAGYEYTETHAITIAQSGSTPLSRGELPPVQGRRQETELAAGEDPQRDVRAAETVDWLMTVGGTSTADGPLSGRTTLPLGLGSSPGKASDSLRLAALDAYFLNAELSS